MQNSVVFAPHHKDGLMLGVDLYYAESCKAIIVINLISSLNNTNLLLLLQFLYVAPQSCLEVTSVTRDWSG